MSERQNYQPIISDKHWTDHSPLLFKKQVLVLKSKEVNPIFGQFDLMELKNNPQVFHPDSRSVAGKTLPFYFGPKMGFLQKLSFYVILKFI